MTRCLWLWPLLALTLSSCTFGRGALKPIAGPGVTLISTHGLPNDTARLSADGVTADVIGRWSEQSETVEIQYRAGRTPTRIAITSASSASTWNGQAAPVTDAWDISVKHPGNVMGRPLLEAGVLKLAPGEQKKVLIIYDRSSPGYQLKIDDEVTIAIPMPGGARPTRFRVTGG